MAHARYGVAAVKRIRADYAPAPPPTCQCAAEPRPATHYSYVGNRTFATKCRVLGWRADRCRKYAKFEVDGVPYCGQHAAKALAPGE